MHTSFESNLPETASQTTVQNIPTQPPLLPYAISEERKQKYLKNERKDAVLMLLFCIGICAVILFVIWLVTFKLGYIIIGGITILSIIGVLSPIVGVYNLISTNIAISKGDYEFSEGVIAFHNEKGYRVYSLNEDALHFVSYEADLGDVAPSGKVVVARIHKSYKLLHHENQ